MQNLRFLDKRDARRIIEKIKGIYGISSLDFDYDILVSKKGRLFLISKAIKKIDLSRLNINSLGLYFGTLEGDLRLSIEGSQLVGKKATKNIIEISDEDVKKWMSGNDIYTSSTSNHFVIIKNKNDFLGSGKCSNGKILNYVPKSRRTKM